MSAGGRISRPWSCAHGRDASRGRLLREAWLARKPARTSRIYAASSKRSWLAIVAEEAVATTDLWVLEGWMRVTWSDIPMILITWREDAPGRNPAAQRLQDASVTALLSTVPSDNARGGLLRFTRAPASIPVPARCSRTCERERNACAFHYTPAAIAMLDRDMRWPGSSRRWTLDFVGPPLAKPL
jgi:hypothetical protein